MNEMTQPRAGRREWLGLAVLLLPTLLIVMDLTVLHLAVPHLTAELQPTSAQLLWIVDIYGFLIAGALITMGTLGDRIGRRRLLLVGAAAFGAASVLAAFSTGAGMLIAARALLGVAGAALAGSLPCRWWPAWPSGSGSSAASAPWPTRWSTWPCSPTGSSAPRWP